MIIKQYLSLIEDDDNLITTLANTSAFIKDNLDDVSWAGFYLLEDDILKLGPFQGKVACTKIPLNKGVCGYCATKQETVIVQDVHQFSGHIACDSATNSEIVVPIVIDEELFGVLDLDSTSFNRFNDNDQKLLEAIVNGLINKIKRSY